MHNFNGKSQSFSKIAFNVLNLIGQTNVCVCVIFCTMSIVNSIVTLESLCVLDWIKTCNSMNLNRAAHEI